MAFSDSSSTFSPNSSPLPAESLQGRTRIDALLDVVKELHALADRHPGLKEIQDLPIRRLAFTLASLHAQVDLVIDGMQSLDPSFLQAETTLDAVGAWLAERSVHEAQDRVRFIANLLQRLVFLVRNADLREKILQDRNALLPVLRGDVPDYAPALDVLAPYEAMYRLMEMEPEDPQYDDLAEQCVRHWRAGRFSILLDALRAAARTSAPETQKPAAVALAVLESESDDTSTEAAFEPVAEMVVEVAAEPAPQPEDVTPIEVVPETVAEMVVEPVADTVVEVAAELVVEVAAEPAPQPEDETPIEVVPETVAEMVVEPVAEAAEEPAHGPAVPEPSSEKPPAPSSPLPQIERVRLDASPVDPFLRAINPAPPRVKVVEPAVEVDDEALVKLMDQFRNWDGR